MTFIKMGDRCPIFINVRSDGAIERERERERERESQLLALIVLTSGVRGVARADRVVRRLVAYVREHDIPRNLIAAATQATPKTYSREK